MSSPHLSYPNSPIADIVRATPDEVVAGKSGNGFLRPPVVAEDLEILDWDVAMQTPPACESGIIEVDLEYAGSSSPLPIDNPWAE